MKKIYIFSLLLILIDQIIKMFVNKLLVNINLINNFLYLTRVENYGAAFGLFSNLTWLLIIISIVILFILHQEAKKERMTKLNVVIYSFVIGGLIGNLLDRIFRGYVLDYISIKIFGYHFPVFNFADILITIGVMLFICKILYKEFKNEISGG